MASHIEYKKEFNIELLGYKKSEVDAFIGVLSQKIEVLVKDVHFLKCELKKLKQKDEKILKPAQR